MHKFRLGGRKGRTNAFIETSYQLYNCISKLSKCPVSKKTRTTTMVMLYRGRLWNQPTISYLISTRWLEV